MKQLITIITILTFHNVLFCQNPIPDLKEGRIKTDQLYGLRKYTEKEISDMPEGIIPAFSEGGVLVDENEFYIEIDSIEVLDTTGIDSFKLIERKIDPPSYLSWGFDWQYNERFVFGNLLLQDNIKEENIYLLLIKKESINSSELTELVIAPEYLKDYPNGIPTKIVTVKKIKKKEPYWITLKEWEIAKQNKNLKQIENIFLGENNESYWYFEPGYYAWWDMMMMERDYRSLTIKIQEALKVRGYNIEVTGIFDNKTKAAFTQFQKDNGLGNLCIQQPSDTLRALGIDE